MKILVILAQPGNGSFNHAIAQVVVNALVQLGHDVVYHDLYAEKFDPILKAEEILSDAEIDLTIKQHCKDLAFSDGIVIVHPNWWGQPPAILKGWIDRVIRSEVAYRFEEGDSGEGVPKGLLRAKKAVVFNTSNTKAQRERSQFGDPLETLWKTCIFDFCGIKNFRRRTFSVIITSTETERATWLSEVKEIIEKEFPTP